MNSVGTLYLVATPIGNLEDISARALRILRQVRLIAAEDTRQTRKLLSHYDIHNPLISYHEHNKLTRLDEVLSALAQGDVALVSDAGTPALNDPGYELVQAALQAGHLVSPIPGPCAPIAALIASGLPTDAFLYLGYLPRKSAERQHLLKSVVDEPYTLIFLETPHRLLKALADLELILGNRQIAIARELTKVHQEIWRGHLSEARVYFSQHPPRGEFTLILEGKCQTNQASEPAKKWTEAQLSAAIRAALQTGEPPSILAKRLAHASGWDRREVYKRLVQR